jgi:release factor family 2
MRLGFLRPLYRQVGGYVSVYLDTSRAHENAPEELALRWRAARARLAGAGADAGTLDAVEAVLNDPARAANGRAVFAQNGAVAFTAPLDRAPGREIARVSALPHVMPLLAQRPPSPPHLRVVAHRGGGDILAVGEGGELGRDARSRRGWPVHKTKAGWGLDKYQRNTEEAWDGSAKEIASGVRDAARLTHPEHIVVAGDTRARALVLNHLSTPLRDRAIVVDSEVAADSTVLARVSDNVIARQAERECRARFGEWQVQQTRSATVEGLADTLAALRDGKVSDLFVTGWRGLAAGVWIGPDGADVAATEAELRELGIMDLAPERADAAMVRAVAATGGALHFLPDDLVISHEGSGGPTVAQFPRDGLCATLRWAR